MSTLEQKTRSGVTGHTVIAGAIAGMIAGAVMAMYAMLASATFLRQGFFTPLYGIASPLTGQDAMMLSVKQGIYFALGPALVGLIVHMMWSAVYGILFGMIARAASLRGVQAVVLGIVYGMGVELVMSLVVLRIIGLGSMPGMIGWPSFTVEHLLFGLVLGLWLLRRPQDAGVRPLV